MKTLLDRWIQRQRKYLKTDATGLGVVLLLALIAYFTQIAPAKQDELTIASDATQVAAQRAQATQLSTVLKVLTAQTQAARRPVSGHVPTFAPASDLNDRLAKIADLAASAGVQVDGIEPQGKSLSGPCFTSTEIKIGGRASYRSVAYLLTSLREKMPDTIVSSINLSAPAPGEAATVNLVVVWYAAPAGVSSATAEGQQ